MGFELAIVGVAIIALLVAGAPAMAALAVLGAMGTALLLRFDLGEA